FIAIDSANVQLFVNPTNGEMRRAHGRCQTQTLPTSSKA
ncbi:MAG: hypothetical protein ACI9BW_004598, partial [Gammaproteobacteria bacterium]